MKTLSAIIASIVLVTSAAAQQPRGLKVFISVDMEGLAGVVTGSDVSSNGPDYPHFRAIMAAETNAAIDGAFRAGATSVLVRDSHGSKQNLLPNDVDPRARLLRGASSGPKNMMEGIDYLPKRYAPPHQVVIFFPPGNALQLPSSKNLPSVAFDFMIKSGRALAFPIYRGTYERGAGELKSDYPDQTVKWREYVIMWGQDYSRTIDYLETRQDVDAARIAYYGLSWGGALGAILPAIESRTRAVVLNVGGLQFQRALPEADQINYVTRITQPTLMLNGRYDHFFPVETSQSAHVQAAGHARPGQTPRDLRRRTLRAAAAADSRDAGLAGPLSRAGSCR